MDEAPDVARVSQPTAAVLGQNTQWKRMMSLPMNSGAADGPVAIAQIIAAVRAYVSALRVADERVGPDVGPTCRRDRILDGIGDAPRLPGAADREVLQTRDVMKLRASLYRKPGSTKSGRSWKRAQKSILIRREPEEPVLLLDPLGLGVVQRALPVH